MLEMFNDIIALGDEEAVPTGFFGSSPAVPTLADATAPADDKEMLDRVSRLLRALYSLLYHQH
jgi:hypothetical protein